MKNKEIKARDIININNKYKAPNKTNVIIWGIISIIFIVITAIIIIFTWKKGLN